MLRVRVLDKAAVNPICMKGSNEKFHKVQTLQKKKRLKVPILICWFGGQISLMGEAGTEENQMKAVYRL